MEDKTFCPKCESENVSMEITAGASVGMPQMWVCKDCGYENYVFPSKDSDMEDEE